MGGGGGGGGGGRTEGVISLTKSGRSWVFVESGSIGAGRDFGGRASEDIAISSRVGCACCAVSPFVP
jgi:hypothetical protein